MNIDDNKKFSKDPLHKRFKSILRSMITDRQLEFLPSEREMQREFGISRTTVRKALNELVSEKRIIAVHGKGYKVVYNKTDSELCGKIGFIIDNGNDVYVDVVFKALIEEVFSKGFEPVVTVIDRRYESPAEKTAALGASTDGLFIRSSLCDDPALLKELESHYNRCVIFPFTNEKNTQFTSISADMGEGARILTNHLLRMGHRKIAVLTSDLFRRQGVLDVFEKRGFNLSGDLLKNCRGTRHDGYETMGMLLSEKADFTAVICQNDACALGVMERCLKEGIKVPEQVSIVGFDNIFDSARYPVPLTTAGINIKTMCREALIMLLEGIRGGKTVAGKAIKPELIKRGSVYKIK
ncbi:MAG: GntR family transcriptional regulator [Lentisphaerae bacterium]|nr:GntR family transcriptional regulator [Lentisphaerota bacterium]MCP4103782.1 GntR family transcriptional regulator [Lentisphaerota bacterium]